ncbi:MAG: response regulator transcription factor [Dehalococcoidia bacterium]
MRVLIADDQDLVRSGLRLILERQPDIEVVGEAADGLEAVERAAELAPDVTLMDIRMPRLDGIEATRRLLSGATPRPAVLILTTFDLDEYVHESLRAGAAGFVLKDCTPDELVHAVRVIAAGEALLAPSVTRRLIEEFAHRPRSKPEAGVTLEGLTEREREVLVLMARGLSNLEIAETLVVSEPTVKTHVGHVLAKLDLRNRVQAVVFAYDHGLVAPAESRPLETP